MSLSLSLSLPLSVTSPSPLLSLSLLDHLSGRNKVAVTRVCTNIAPLWFECVSSEREGEALVEKVRASVCACVSEWVSERGFYMVIKLNSHRHGCYFDERERGEGSERDKPLGASRMSLHWNKPTN